VASVADDPKARLRKMLESYRYPGDVRVNGPGPAERVALSVLAHIGQAVYVTTDDLWTVDYWLRERMEVKGSVGIQFQSSGRRWSFFQDGIPYRKSKVLKRRQMTVRQYVSEHEGVCVVVLAFRPPDLSVTQIAVTIVPKPII
jgi:hypothetical protein